jgi:hypothetical protein
VRILPPDSFMIYLHTCSGFVSALVSLMEHTLSFFVEFPIPWVCHLSVTENSHLFIEPFFNLMKCSLGSV